MRRRIDNSQKYPFNIITKRMASILSTTCFFAVPHTQTALAQTINYPSSYFAISNTETADTNREKNANWNYEIDGATVYEFIPPPRTTREWKKVTIVSGVTQSGVGGNDGYGGDTVDSTRGGNGGSGISDSNLIISNSGIIQGGTGGNGRNEFFSFVGEDHFPAGNGGTGGAGISGNDLIITNSGTIYGGNGGNAGAPLSSIGGITGTGGTGGNGGMGISGSNLTITNNGRIENGHQGISSNGIISTEVGTAIRTTGGVNSLSLKAGSEIRGDVVLSAMPDAVSTNTLSIINDVETLIDGNLNAGAYTDLILSGKTITFTGDSRFEDNAILSFSNFGGEVALNTKTLSFSGANIEGSSNINNWNQAYYTLATTTNGVSGIYNDKIENALLTDGAKDYAGIIVTNHGKNLSYGLKWNNAEDAYGTFNLKHGATLTLGVVMADNTDLTASNTNDWDGKGLTKTGDGTLILTAKNTYTGATSISEGTMKLGRENAIASTSEVTVAEGATLNLGGNSQTLTSLNNNGTVLINDTGTDVLANVVNLTGDVINNGTMLINNGSRNTRQTLQVNGEWRGNGGTVFIGTMLGKDDSLTDKLTITGNATGTTYVTVSNEGGRGARTLEGIEVISTGSSTSNAFLQEGRITVGSYDYFLQQGNTSGVNMNNWYLMSKETYRPERGSYASNLQAAGTMFNTRQKDRQSSSVYIDPITGEHNGSSLWLRSVGGHSQGHMSDGQSNFSANRVVLQIGGDVLSGSLDSDDVWNFGLMGGYGKQYSNTHNKLSGYQSKGAVWGYSTGIYSTWYQNAKKKTGLYVDSWLTYNWFDNSVKGDQLAYEKYKTKGLTAALETGYVFHTGSYATSDSMENNFYVTPQAQVLWSGVKADAHTEANGTNVEGNGSDNVQTRLGIRLSMTRQSHLDKGFVKKFEPFVEANWVYKSKDYGVKMDNENSYIQGQRNMVEFKIGMEGRVSESLGIQGSVVQQMGANSYQDTQGVLGVKYAF